MVISKREATSLRFGFCHLHDMMREICLFKAKEENFLQITSSSPPTTNFQSTVTSRRFVSHNPTTLHVERDINNPKLRSLVVFHVKLSGSNYTRLELLRVLDLYKAKFEKGELPSGIGKLIHLRYLSLKDAEVSHLPSSLGNLKMLIYLNFEISYPRSILVPNVLMGMKELRYLALPWNMRRKTKLELSNQVNLETLRKFSTKNSSLEDLRGMVRLRTLDIKLTEETSMETVYASIGGLRYLETLHIKNGRIEEDIVMDFVNLKELRLYNMQMTRFPKEQHFPSRLMILYLSNCRLEEDPMPILEKLLQLKEVYLWSVVFSGRRMVCSGGGFPKLQKLDLVNLFELEEWIVEEGSMPLLHTLTIHWCPKLKEVPDGLRFLHSLKDLAVRKQWKERLSVGGADHDKVKHIPSVIFYVEIVSRRRR